MKNIPNVIVLGPELGKPRTGIVSFYLLDRDASEIAFQLDRYYGIAVRAGYHCTPLAHQSVNTTETGAVRASVGYNTTVEDIYKLIDAVTAIQSGKH
ncbi:putative cysteine desulfurase [compost metagenome]